MSKRQLEWQIEDDAQVLKRYAEIVSDTSRMRSAKAYLDKEAKRIENAKAVTLGSALTQHYSGSKNK